MHPATHNQKFTFNLSIDGGSNYNVTKTSTHFRAYHTESGSSTGLGYRTGDDLAQGTGYQTLVLEGGNDNDANSVGILHLFDPSNTTFVKHYLIRAAHSSNSDYARDQFISGYFNTTSAIDALKFEMRTGNIEIAVLKMYGVL